MNVDNTICEKCGRWVEGLNGEPWNHACPEEAENKALREGWGVTVKPLAWRDGHAHGVGHHYFTRNGCLYRNETSGETGLHCGPSWEIEEAAQADYERRILSALSPAPVAVDEVTGGEELSWFEIERRALSEGDQTC
ncbi:MAG: hypothetical protein FKY71_08140 [Spiribacter salinus]|uniref:Uncharacterized protein n=1 Tax=Spiribacter salinus TaxID=1335746 RepID=A0A540VRY3_9GAMM|nr:MAG: hypothetical protein FKY71_08140 [Spiribacter salinus]